MQSDSSQLEREHRVNPVNVLAEEVLCNGQVKRWPELYALVKEICARCCSRLAEDVAQEVSVKLLTTKAGYVPGHSFAAWCSTIAHNALIVSCDILARNMAQRGEDAKWRQRLGADRKVIGDFAWYLHCTLGLAAR